MSGSVSMRTCGPCNAFLCHMLCSLGKLIKKIDQVDKIDQLCEKEMSCTCASFLASRFEGVNWIVEI